MGLMNKIYGAEQHSTDVLFANCLHIQLLQSRLWASLLVGSFSFPFVGVFVVVSLCVHVCACSTVHTVV